MTRLSKSLSNGAAPFLICLLVIQVDVRAQDKTLMPLGQVVFIEEIIHRIFSPGVIEASKDVVISIEVEDKNVEEIVRAIETLVPAGTPKIIITGNRKEFFQKFSLKKVGYLEGLIMLTSLIEGAHLDSVKGKIFIRIPDAPET